MQTHANMQLGPDTADELIERAPQSEAACLVVDVQLGKQTGIELGRRLGYTFPIIFITGSNSLFLQKQAMAFGVGGPGFRDSLAAWLR